MINTDKQRIKFYFDFLIAMTAKEIGARYKRAIFGFLWIILNPVLQMLIIGIIFSIFIKIPNYFVFLFSGLLPWQFFSLSLSKATSSIVNERTLLQKSKFPIEAIPISIILSNFFNMIISLIFFLITLAILKMIIFPQILLLIPILIWLLLFTIGISLLTASLNVRYRDVNFFIQTLLILWFYATPILYALPATSLDRRIVFSINPLASLFDLMHYAILKQGVIDMRMIVINLTLSIFILITGIAVYKKSYKYFVDWI